MNTTDDAANSDDLSGPVGRRSSAGLTVVLVLALWVAIVLVLAIGQIILNRSFGVDLEVGSLPGVWDWVLTAAIVLVTWFLVRRRHPQIGL